MDQMEKQIDFITDLLVDFDEMGFVPTTACPDPEAYAVEWKRKITEAFEKACKQSEGEWISVTERLPRESGKYIVCTNGKNPYQCKFYTYPENKGGHWGQKDNGKNITHWMPFPEPPKTKGGEG